MKLLSKIIETSKKEIETFINDRRYAKRYEIPLKLNYRNPFTNRLEESTTKNICRTGIRFPVSAKIPKGTLLELNIEDPNSRSSIDSKAKVVWLEEFIVGDDADKTIWEIGVKLLRRRLF